MKFSNYNIKNMIGCHNYYFLNNIYLKKKSVNFTIKDKPILDILNKMYNYSGDDLINSPSLNDNESFEKLKLKMDEFINVKIQNSNLLSKFNIDIIYKNINFECNIDNIYEDSDNIILFNYMPSKLSSLVRKLYKTYTNFTKLENEILGPYLNLTKKKELNKYYDSLINTYYLKFIYENSKYYNKYKNLHYVLLLLNDELNDGYYFSFCDVTDVINNTYNYFLDEINELIVKTNEKETYLVNECKNTSCKFYNICVNNKQKIKSEEIINKDRLTKELDKLTYPLYYLDFESYQSPYPRFSDELPYSVYIFQYSLIKQSSKEELEYYDYLAENNKDDFRYDLFKHLTNDLNLDNGGSVIVYNETFEKNHIIENAHKFSSLKDKLLKISDNIIDLEKILKGPSKNDPNYYNSIQKNSYSIKKVINAFSNSSYENLDLNIGTMASIAYINLDKLDDEKKTNLRNDLIKYCRKDTYSMYEILKGIKEKVDYKK